MNGRPCSCFIAAALFAAISFLHTSRLAAQATPFHGVPSASVQRKNPYAGQQPAITAGAKLYAANCASCHGANGSGSGNVPALSKGPTQSASDGEVFWFITTGSINNGMPPWATLSEQKRWQIVSYLKSLTSSPVATPPATASAAAAPVATNAPPPKPPFTDFRYQRPGTTHKITTQDLPAPYATTSAGNGPKVVARPEGAWPKAPAGFLVQEYATGLDNPRLIRTAPNGDFFLAESSSGKIKIFRGITADGKPQQATVFATGLNQPYGIAFYPPGDNPQWVYVGNTDAVVRFPYRNGDLAGKRISATHHRSAPRRRPLDARHRIHT